MTTVYIIIGGHDYEGFSNLFVSTDKEKAKQFQQLLEKDNIVICKKGQKDEWSYCKYDYIHIEEHELK